MREVTACLAPSSWLPAPGTHVLQACCQTCLAVSSNHTHPLGCSQHQSKFSLRGAQLLPLPSSTHSPSALLHISHALPPHLLGALRPGRSRQAVHRASRQTPQTLALGSWWQCQWQLVQPAPLQVDFAQELGVESTHVHTGSGRGLHPQPRVTCSHSASEQWLPQQQTARPPAAVSASSHWAAYGLGAWSRALLELWD